MKQNLNCSGSTRVDGGEYGEVRVSASLRVDGCLLYTSDAADE